jgi:N-acetyltransferase 10
LLVIDEAASIPIKLVHSLITSGKHPCFISSTVQGYEGTGRSLSLKLVSSLRAANSGLSFETGKGQKRKKMKQRPKVFRMIRELQMEIPIRYGLNDPVENWLNEFLCLDATSAEKLKDKPEFHSNCSLYFVNKETLFSYKKTSEKFLHRIWSLFVSSHYKNSPNDLQLLADAPGHSIAILLGPLKKSKESKKAQLPDVLCAAQICFEGNLNTTIEKELGEMGRSHKPSGDMIPWNLSQQYMNSGILNVLGVRVVRIATHPEALNLGLGTKMLQELATFFEGKMVYDGQRQGFFEFLNGGANQGTKQKVPPLLKLASTLRAPKIEYLGVAFGLTPKLYRFWGKNGFSPLYIRQSKNNTTGEHSVIMIKPLTGNSSEETLRINFPFLFDEFKRRFARLLSMQFRDLDIGTCITMMDPNLSSKITKTTQEGQDHLEYLKSTFNFLDLKRLQHYTKGMIDYHMIRDLVPIMSESFFLGKFGGKVKMSYTQAVILLAMGLQHREIEFIAKEADIDISHCLALFNKSIRKLANEIKRAKYR